MRSLPTQDIHLRHRVFSQATADSCWEAARVCLTKSCPDPSPASFIVKDNDHPEEVSIEWKTADPIALNAWGANQENSAIEKGACICAIAAVELRRDLFAVENAWKGSGVDYILLPRRIYMAPGGAEDLEEAWGLEVSGTILGDDEVRKRLQRKLQQAHQGDNTLPTLACVVGFKVKSIVMKTVKG